MKPKMYNVELIHAGSDRVSVIKTYRDMTGIGIKDAVGRVDSAPSILLKTADLSEAEQYKSALEGLGAMINISSDEDIPQAETNAPAKLKKLGLSFIIISILCVFGVSAFFSGMIYYFKGLDFISLIIVISFLLLIFWIISFAYGNKLMAHISAKTIEKNAFKQGFDKAYRFSSFNSDIMIDVLNGRIAYISHFAPYSFQVVNAKDIINIGFDHSKMISTTMTHYVYFQFTYQSKQFRLPTFRSKQIRPISSPNVQEALQTAERYSLLLQSAKQVALSAYMREQSVQIPQTNYPDYDKYY